MANKLFLQTILKFSDKIKDGSVRITDIVDDYFRTSGKAPTEEESAILLKEFQDNAPDNVTTLEGVDAVETILPMRGPNVQRAGDMSDTAFTDTLRKQNPDVEIRGDEGFDELMQKLGPAKEEGIGSLFPKGKGAAFEKIDDRDEVAEFIRNMRGAGIKNKDIRGVFKETGTDIEGGKRAATTLARAADMGADTISKQEVLADLDDDIANYGPNWWKGEGYNDGPMGFESRGQATRNVITKINNGIVDDLEKAGVDEEKVSFIFRNLSDVRDRLQNDPKAFVQKVADELEFEDIDYDLSFWNKYVDEIMSRIQKAEPRFMYGGAV
jgi:hypothetical protein